jgi:hypothetical protein
MLVVASILFAWNVTPVPPNSHGVSVTLACCCSPCPLLCLCVLGVVLSCISSFALFQLMCPLLSTLLRFFLQILYLVLHGLLRGQSPPRVCVPHGAESGFDPYQAYDNVTDENYFGYIHGKMLSRDRPGEWVRVPAVNVYMR